MSIINRFLRKINPSNLLAMLLILLVVGLLNIAALYASPERTIQGQQPQAMRRESAQPTTLEEALNLSLAYGDGRKVDFVPFGLSWEV